MFKITMYATLLLCVGFLLYIIDPAREDYISVGLGDDPIAHQISLLGGEGGGYYAASRVQGGSWLYRFQIAEGRDLISGLRSLNFEYAAGQDGADIILQSSHLSLHSYLAVKFDIEWVPADFEPSSLWYYVGDVDTRLRSVIVGSGRDNGSQYVFLLISR